MGIGVGAENKIGRAGPGAAASDKASRKAAVVMTNPAGTGNPDFRRRASPAPFPPAMRASRALRLERGTTNPGMRYPSFSR